MSGSSARSLRHTLTRGGRGTTGQVRALNLSRRTPAGVAEPVSAPSEEAIRKHVLAGICPFCGLGPYKVLAGHTSKAHAVDRFQLREMAGLFYTASILAPEDRAERVAISKRAFDQGLTLTPEMTRGKGNVPHRLSPAARALQGQKVRKAVERDPDLARRRTAAAVMSRTKRLLPVWQEAVQTYETVLAEQEMAYGAVAETARRLGWPEQRTLRRLEAAWKLGLGTHEKAPRRTDERRTCQVCGDPYVVTRSAGWSKKTCSVRCGAKLAGDQLAKPARTTVCSICGVTFTYKRQGTQPRKTCGSDECRSEVSRRAGSRTPSEETRRKISESKKRRLAERGEAK